jgi:hypothetical protein
MAGNVQKTEVAALAVAVEVLVGADILWDHGRVEQKRKTRRMLPKRNEVGKVLRRTTLNIHAALRCRDRTPGAMAQQA